MSGADPRVRAVLKLAPVIPVFVFDTDILDALPNRADRRVEFIHKSVLELDAALRELAARNGVDGGGLIVLLCALFLVSLTTRPHVKNSEH